MDFYGSFYAEVQLRKWLCVCECFLLFAGGKTLGLLVLSLRSAGIWGFGLAIACPDLSSRWVLCGILGPAFNFRTWTRHMHLSASLLDYGRG